MYESAESAEYGYNKLRLDRRLVSSKPRYVRRALRITDSLSVSVRA